MRCALRCSPWIVCWSVLFTLVWLLLSSAPAQAQADDSPHDVFLPWIAGGTRIPAPPVAEFGAAPRQGSAPLTVTFHNRSTGAGSYTWNFGDGTTASTAQPSHTYTAPGTYSVTLTAQNAAGDSTQVQAAYITVTETPAQPPAEWRAGMTPAGGTLTTPDGALTLDFAPDALTTPHTIGVVQTDLTEWITDTVNGAPRLSVPAEGRPFRLFALHAYDPETDEIVPIQFSAPVTLTYAYSTTLLDDLVESSLHFQYFNEADGTFNDLPTTVTTTTHTMQTVLTHFSTYSAAGDRAGWITPAVEAGEVSLARGIRWARAAAHPRHQPDGSYGGDGLRLPLAGAHAHPGRQRCGGHHHLRRLRARRGRHAPGLQ